MCSSDLPRTLAASSMTPTRKLASWWGSFALARTGIPPSRKAAQAFVDHLNAVINRTVTDSRLSLIPLPDDDDAFEITRLVDRARTPLDLRRSSLQLFVRQTVVVVGGHCQTESYTYRLQSGGSAKSWLLRWEYYRDLPRPDFLYPLAHVHVNGAFENGEAIARLHVPTRRIPLELVIWHLVAEWGVEPRSDDWAAVLEASITGFDERRTAH